MRSVPSLALASVLLLPACNSNFFRISKENEEARPPHATAKPAPAARPAPPPRAPVPVTKPTAVPATVPVPVKAAPAIAVATPDTFDIEPTPTASDSAGIERLVQLATVWSALAQFHPYLQTRGVPLDSALVRVVPMVRNARDAAGMRTALSALTATFGDSLTRVSVAAQQPPRLNAPTAITNATTGDSVLIITLPLDQLNDNSASLLRSIAQRARSTAHVVLDLRASTMITTADASQALAHLDELMISSGLISALTEVPLTASGEQHRVIGAMYQQATSTEFTIGSEPAAWQSSASSWIASSAVPVTRAVADAPAKGRSRKNVATVMQEVPRRVAIVVNRNTVLPRSVLALAANENVAMFAEGQPNDAAAASTLTHRIDGVGQFQMRIGYIPGAKALRVTTLEPSASGDTNTASMRAALLAVRGGSLPPISFASATKSLLPAAFDSAAYPVMGARLLGVFRLWSAMRTLHAHRDSYDDDLDEVFRRAIGQAEAARNAAEYARALIELATSTDDSRVLLHGPSIEDVRGQFALPFVVRWVESRPVVTQLANDASMRAAGVAIGDEITAIEGLPVTAWLTTVRRVGPASNDWMREQLQMETLRRGPQGSAILRVRDAKGTERGVTIPRSLRFPDSANFARPTTAFVRQLDASVLYVDATAAQGWSLPSASPRAVIVDLRGPLARNISALHAVLPRAATNVVARRVRRGASAPCFSRSLRMALVECADERRVDPVYDEDNSSRSYTGLVVALVDERTDARGELLAMQLEASGARIAGSPTAGAVAPVSTLRVPGNITIDMPLEEYRRADGGQLHRVGVNPSLDLRPTIRGIRNGVDDVLDRALQFVQQEMNPAPRRKR